MNKWILKERNTNNSYLAAGSVVQILRNVKDMDQVRKFDTRQAAEECARKIHTFGLTAVEIDDGQNKTNN